MKIKELCIKLVICKSLYYGARSENHHDMTKLISFRNFAIFRSWSRYL